MDSFYEPSFWLQSPAEAEAVGFDSFIPRFLYSLTNICLALCRHVIEVFPHLLFPADEVKVLKHAVERVAVLELDAVAFWDFAIDFNSKSICVIDNMN